VKNRRKIAWAVAAAAGVAMVCSAGLMARRVATFHRENRRETYAFKSVTSRAFDYNQRPVSISDERGDGKDGGAGNDLRVVVRYGDDTLTLSPTLPSDTRLPGLIAHEDWMRVLRFAAATGSTLDQLRARMDSGQVRDRLLIVTRSPEPGSDPSSRGEVNKRAWTFDFYEFAPGGGFDHQRKSFPVKRRADLRTGEVPPAPDNELKENTWQYQAALMVMPPARGPNPQFSNDGLHAMGWTLPATSISMLTMLGALMFAASPKGDRSRGAQAPL